MLRTVSDVGYIVIGDGDLLSMGLMDLLGLVGKELKVVEGLQIRVVRCRVEKC